MALVALVVFVGSLASKMKSAFPFMYNGHTGKGLDILGIYPVVIEGGI